MMIWEGFGRKRSWPNFKVLFRHSPGGKEKIQKKISNHDRRSPGRESNTGPPEHEVGVLNTRPRRLVRRVESLIFLIGRF
jgi:hypothetical protein